jgi:hypothetical protein
MDMGRRDLDVGSNNYVIVEIMQVNMLELVHVEVLIVEVNGVSEVNIEAKVCACLVFGFCFHIALFHHTTIIQIVIEGTKVFPNVPTPHPVFDSFMHVNFSAQ